jgi:uncharacterized RDD family membrane protein YckC
LVILFTPRQQAIHDLAAPTFVVETGRTDLVTMRPHIRA